MMYAGIGLRQDATLDSLRNALAKTGAQSVVALATPFDKAVHPAIVALRKELDIQIMAIGAQEMEAQETVTQAERVIEKRGTGSVAEACALAAAGHGAELTVSRVISDDRMATCAIAVRRGL